jgi:hypothetical protein
VETKGINDAIHTPENCGIVLSSFGTFISLFKMNSTQSERFESIREMGGSVIIV